jgi:hypothetical protein
MTIPFDTLLEGIGYVVSGAAVLAAIIPTAGGEKASKALRFVRRVIDVLAMNIGNAKNATDAAKAQAQDKQKAK